jgi:hypothetical protein
MHSTCRAGAAARIPNAADGGRTGKRRGYERRSAPARSAVRLAGAAARLRECISAPLSASEQQLLRHNLQPAWRALGEGAGAAAWTEGQAMTLEEVIAQAVAVGKSAQPSHGHQ